MKIKSATKAALVLVPNRSDGVHGRSWCFDVGILPEKPQPKKIVIERKVGRSIQRWEMSWRKLMRQTAIGDIALIDKSEFSYSSALAKGSNK